MAFLRPATDDDILASHMLQIIYAWEGVVGKGVPLDLSEVDSAEYALKVKNKNAASLCFQFLTSGGLNMLRGAGATLHLGQNMVVTAGKTVDGVDLGTHAATTDTHIAASTGIHGATPTATANRLLIRDGAGRGKVAAPSAADDIARKDTVDAVTTFLNTHKTATPIDHPNSSVTEAKIADEAVTSAKMADRAPRSVMGRADGFGGPPVDISAGANDLVLSRAGETVAFREVSGAMLANGAVTSAKLGANSVDDTKVGNRVAQFYRRQGGHATNWHVAGATTYTPGAVRMQGGASTLNEAGAVTVTFDPAFSAVPLVFLTNTTFEGTAVPCVQTVSASQMTVRGMGSGSLNWLAIGPE